jgi:hypothetical protein
MCGKTVRHGLRLESCLVHNEGFPCFQRFPPQSEVKIAVGGEKVNISKEIQMSRNTVKIFS